MENVLNSEERSQFVFVPYLIVTKSDLTAKRILRDILEKVFGKIDKIKILEIIKEHEDEYEIAESPQETLDNNLSEDYHK